MVTPRITQPRPMWISGMSPSEPTDRGLRGPLYPAPRKIPWSSSPGSAPLSEPAPFELTGLASLEPSVDD